VARFGFVRPGKDPGARTLSGWGSVVIDLVKRNRNHTISYDLRPKLWSRLAATDVIARLADSDVVLYFGHGDKGRWLGPDPLDPLLDVTNAAASQGNIVIAIACWTSDSLGPACAGRRARAYLGFSDELAWAPTQQRRFGMAVADALAVFINRGESIDSARERLEQAFSDLRDSFKGPDRNQRDANIAWLAADWNARHIMLHGSSVATA